MTQDLKTRIENILGEHRMKYIFEEDSNNQLSLIDQLSVGNVDEGHDEIKHLAECLADELELSQQEIIRSLEAKVEERDLWLNEVLNSDMAMREEDEGAISPILNEIRLLLGKQK